MMRMMKGIDLGFDLDRDGFLNHDLRMMNLKNF